MHRYAPRPSSSELADAEIAAVMEATAGAREDRVVFVATSQWCARSLGKFGAEVRLLEMLAGGGKEAMASSVAAVVRDAKEVFEWLGRMLESV